MGQTRVDLLHLLEDLRDAYPGSLEETILTEIVANSLDSGARRIWLRAEGAEAVLAPPAADATGTHAFVTRFLARWGEALTRDRRRRSAR